MGRFAMLTVALCALSIVPVSIAIRERADVIEVNRYHDADGNLVFTQVIFWEWSGEDFRVFAWRMVKSPRQLPVVEHRQGYTANPGYKMTWIDNGHLRSVRSPSVRYTWTQYDPELRDRKIFSPDERRGLCKR